MQYPLLTLLIMFFGLALVIWLYLLLFRKFFKNLIKDSIKEAYIELFPSAQRFSDRSNE